MTPIQTAIRYWKKRAKESPNLQLRAAAGWFVKYLEANLKKERKWAEDIWELGQFSTDAVEMDEHFDKIYKPKKS